MLGGATAFDGSIHLCPQICLNLLKEISQYYILLDLEQSLGLPVLEKTELK